MMQSDEFEKFIKDNIKIPDDIDVSFLMLEREATAIEIGVTVSIVLVILVILLRFRLVHLAHLRRLVISLL